MTRSILYPVIVICILLYEVLRLLLTFHTGFVYKIVLHHFHLSSVPGRKVRVVLTRICLFRRDNKFETAVCLSLKLHRLITADLMDSNYTGLL
jgi:hypothetical protein